LTHECSASEELKATLTYLSSAGTGTRKIEESRFLSSSDPEGTAGLHIQYRELEPGVIQTTYDLSHSQPMDWFFFVFMGSMGHAIYV
jgi:hypothetical protein